MQKTILITGSTDGIGLETAKILTSQGYRVLLHGRNQSKLLAAEKILSELTGGEKVESYLADLSNMGDVETLAKTVRERHDKIDVLINNAGILKTHEPITQDGLDVRFVVNTLAPYLLTKKLLPLMDNSARVISLSSAAQSPVNLGALTGKVRLNDDLNAYAQSKLAMTMWSRYMALAHKDKGPVFIAVNPGSLLATKMVKEGFGMAGNDIRIGVDILIRLALADEFSTASGKYYDNDVGRFADPHNDALKPQKIEEVMEAIEKVLNSL
ncbi:MAG: SDR family NAD(P)-dependent oxidoreductase [Gammaproteobacteria bacterium]|nr:SDR family NAD(P)-dependent oxidoreductase [Gammaproteobacteria bacterium]